VEEWREGKGGCEGINEGGSSGVEGRGVCVGGRGRGGKSVRRGEGVSRKRRQVLRKKPGEKGKKRGLTGPLSTGGGGE